MANLFRHTDSSVLIFLRDLLLQKPHILGDKYKFSVLISNCYMTVAGPVLQPAIMILREGQVCGPVSQGIRHGAVNVPWRITSRPYRVRHTVIPLCLEKKGCGDKFELWWVSGLSDTHCGRSQLSAAGNVHYARGHGNGLRQLQEVLQFLSTVRGTVVIVGNILDFLFIPCNTRICNPK
ncbi:hypothetical protein J6590_102513 [Homalodisca vitripennis]|nr:hypothetical protein J6590_102513 [Homalodisca vitripennis]